MKKRFTRIMAALALLVFMAQPMKVLATDIVVTLDNIGVGLGSTANTAEATTDITATGTTDVFTLNYYQCKKQGNAMFMTKSVDPYISNHTPMPGNIKSVEVFINSGAAGKTTYDCAFSTTECHSAVSGIGAVNITGGNSHVFSNLLNGSINVEGEYFCITLGNANNGQVLKLVITCEDSSSTTLATTTTISNTGITNTDIKDGTNAGSLSATVTETTSGNAISGASVTWSGDNDAVATINANTGAVTLVSDGTVRFTASYAGTDQYDPSQATYDMTVIDSRYLISDLTFTAACGGTGTASTDDAAEWTVTSDGSESNFDATSGIHYGTNNAAVTYVQLATSGINGTIKKVVVNARDAQAMATITVAVGGTSFTCTGGATATNSSADYIFTGTGTGEIIVRIDRGESMTKAIYVKSVKVYYIPSTDPVIVATNPDALAYDATSGEFTYSITNPTSATLTATSNNDWITNVAVDGTNSKVTFSTSINENTTQRQGTITLSYTGATDKVVTITQAGAPVIYTTIPALFEAATSTNTNVNVTFGNWVVSGVSGSNAFVTDNIGNGFIIYTSDHGFEVNDVLSGTVMGTPMKLYKGSAEFTNLTSTTADLSVSNDGTITVINDKTIAELGGVNTGAVITLSNLTYNGTNLSDGTNTIKPFNTLYNSMSFTSGKTYNVTGVYQQYDNTKEILPRSADDIVEVEVQHEEYTLTVSDLSHVNLFIFGGDESETIISTEDGETTAQVYDGTEVLVSIDVEAGYVFKSLTITDGNGDPVNLEELTANEYYSFVMPTSDVTITASAEVLTGDQYELYSGTLVEGDYLIVYGDYVMKNTVTSSRLDYVNMTATNDVITTDNAAVVWHIAKSGDYWTIYSADAEKFAASTGSANKAQLMADGTDDKALWTVYGNETYEFVNKQNTTNNVNANLRNNGTYGFACYSTSTGGALSLYKKVEPETESYTLTINGYTDVNSKAGYYLIASPVTVNIADVDGLAEGDFDLYSYDESQELEWINYKQEDGSHPFTTLEPGKGYLYAKKATADTPSYTFTLTGTPYDGTPIVLSKQSTGTLAGWNLIGNPLATSNIAPGRAFYIMNSTTGELIASESNTVEPKQGFFVIAEEDDEVFELTVPLDGDGNLDKLVMNLSQNRGTVIDRAIIRFGEGEQLPKFQLNPNNTKIYFAQADNDYAVVRSASEGEMPVSFRAAENGTYTLSFSAENTEMRYMHLIDNMTGNDIDLLQTPSYSFEAKTTDYANRFRIVFNANNGVDEMDEDSFAFFNGSEWVINNEGEATLQVIDMMGRVVSSQTVNGNANVNINEAKGMYVIRLIQNDLVKTQKIVKE